jgi:hypothetical protein
VVKNSIDVYVWHLHKPMTPKAHEWAFTEPRHNQTVFVLPVLSERFMLVSAVSEVMIQYYEATCIYNQRIRPNHFAIDWQQNGEHHYQYCISIYMITNGWSNVFKCYILLEDPASRYKIVLDYNVCVDNYKQCLLDIGLVIPSLLDGVLCRQKHHNYPSEEILHNMAAFVSEYGHQQPTSFDLHNVCSNSAQLLITDGV